MKACASCGLSKPLEDFHKSPRKSDGRQSWCKACQLEDLQRKRNDPANKELFAKYARRHNLKRYYGLTLEQYDKMLEKQNGVCAICRKPSEKALAVDHNHETKEVRGLLCGRCNTAIGLLNEDPDLLRQAIAYLSEFYVITSDIQAVRALLVDRYGD